MAQSTAAQRRGALEPVVLGASTVGVAFIGYFVAPQLDDLMFAIAAVTVAAIIGLGASLLVRYATGLAALGRTPAVTAWVAPVAWYLATLLAGRLLALDDSWPTGGAAVAALVLLLLAQQREFHLPVGQHRAAEFVVNLGVFVSAFALFGLVREQRLAPLLGALLCGGISCALAVVPLRRALASGRRTLAYAVLVGGVVGQIAWALGYWTLPAIVAGAVLLLALYVFVGLGEAILDRSFSQRIVLEYGVVGACGLALIVGVGPWRA